MNERYAKVMDAVAKEDAVRLRELASDYSDEAAIHQDDETILLAIVTYSFHKIFSKIHFREKTEKLVESSLKHISEGNLQKVVEDIEAFDLEHGIFQGSLIGKARIKIGSRLYSRGMSANYSSALTGASVAEIMDYSGDTKHHEEKERIPLVERLNKARDLFKRGR